MCIRDSGQALDPGAAQVEVGHALAIGVLVAGHYQHLIAAVEHATDHAGVASMGGIEGTAIDGQREMLRRWLVMACREALQR